MERFLSLLFIQIYFKKRRELPHIEAALRLFSSQAKR